MDVALGTHPMRIHSLERDVSELREGQARQDEILKQLKESIDKIEKTVDDLNNTMQKGKGALWVVASIGAAIGVVSEVIASFISGRH
jgi:hypothetical protein